MENILVTLTKLFILSFIIIITISFFKLPLKNHKQPEKKNNFAKNKQNT